MRPAETRAGSGPSRPGVGIEAGLKIVGAGDGVVGRDVLPGRRLKSLLDDDQNRSRPLAGERRASGSQRAPDVRTPDARGQFHWTRLSGSRRRDCASTDKLGRIDACEKRPRAVTGGCDRIVLGRDGPRTRYQVLRSGGDGGIRTLDTLVGYAHLANECLQPLGHVSGARLYA